MIQTTLRLVTRSVCFPIALITCSLLRRLPREPLPHQQQPSLKVFFSAPHDSRPASPPGCPAPPISCLLLWWERLPHQEELVPNSICWPPIPPDVHPSPPLQPALLCFTPAPPVLRPRQCSTALHQLCLRCSVLAACWSGVILWPVATTTVMPCSVREHAEACFLTRQG